MRRRQVIRGIEPLFQAGTKKSLLEPLGQPIVITATNRAVIVCAQLLIGRPEDYRPGHLRYHRSRRPLVPALGTTA